MIAVLAPVLRRPDRAGPLAESLFASEPDATLMWLCSPGDLEEQQACQAAGGVVTVVAWEPGHADWARKINYGFALARNLGCRWMLLGSDDLRFHAGWADEAVRVGDETGACVVGTNDLGNATVMRGDHSTHPLVHRDYLECGTVDAEGRIASECYWHNWVDAELVQTAKSRGTWAFADGSHVEHLHPFWRKGDDDPVYQLGRSHYKDDQDLYYSRRHLWGQT